MAQNTCDSLNTVTFTYQSAGAYSYLFTPVPPVSGASILYTEWGSVVSLSRISAWRPSLNTPFPDRENTWSACAPLYRTAHKPASQLTVNC
ncbi:MAG: hypothetical protein IPP95_10525 [Flavobacteriales bacterium]|nr:MAG: hypothetical protein IPP95_10525 [Flavobacteriales bacterium]